MEITARDFRVAHAGDGEWRALVEDCIEQLGDIPSSANLGFLYVTDALDESFERIAERLGEATGVKDWVGTIGFGVCVGGREYFDRPAMVALVCAIPDDDYRLMPTVSRPQTRIDPADGRSSPMMWRRSVDFPLPLPPRITKISPR